MVMWPNFQLTNTETKEQFLRDIFNIELESRQTKKVANLIKKAKFRELKWLKNYEWSEQIHLPSTTSQEHICELRFLKANKIFYYLDLLEQENTFSHSIRFEGL